MVVVGLGNPGPRYAFTRHNVGFLFLDHLLKGRGEWKHYKNFLWTSKKLLEQQEVVLVKPLTFMNLSGLAVLEVLRSFDVGVGDIIVVYDDASLKLGKIRIRKRGSDGGHNGMKSIIEALGTEEIARIRIGIGEKPKDVDLVSFVLGGFSEEEFAVLQKVFDVTEDALKMILTDGIDKAMSVFNASEVRG